MKVDYYRYEVEAIKMRSVKVLFGIYSLMTPI